MARFILRRFLDVADVFAIFACGPKEVGDENGDDCDEKHGCDLRERPHSVSLRLRLGIIGHEMLCKNICLAV